MPVTTGAPTSGGALRADARRNIEAILDAGERCLARNPDASVGDIAAEAGLGRVTIYGHFKSRAVLIEAITRRALATANEAVAGLDLAGDRNAALTRLVDTLWQVTARSSFLVIAAERALPASVLAEAHQGPLQQRVETFIRDGQASGAFRADLPVGWLIAAFHSLLHAAVTETYAGRLDVADGPRVVRTAILAVLTAPG
jgi:TetR/AcrR family transcriptional repressor of mexCD-oprJ operon